VGCGSIATVIVASALQTDGLVEESAVADRPGLYLQCHACGQRSLLLETCSTCGADWKNFSVASSAQGGRGWFCQRCQNGFNLATCTACNASNAHTQITKYYGPAAPQIPCAACGAMILHATAQRHNGKCAQCAKRRSRSGCLTVVVAALGAAGGMLCLWTIGSLI
jgi:DNA-directed RNA polymerase subunit RPC12/RpoP